MNHGSTLKRVRNQVTKNQIIQKLYTYGDAIVEFKDRNMEAIAVTIVMNEKYITKKLKKLPYRRNKKGVTVWSWTEDTVTTLFPNTIYRITPMSKILNNEESL